MLQIHPTSRCNSHYLGCLLFIVVFWGVTIFPLAFSLAAGTNEKKPLFFSGGKEPVKITADNLEYDQKKNLAIYSGSVRACQKDTTLDCDKLQIILSRKQQKLDQIIATGKKVVIKIQQKTAKCRKAHYFAVNRRLVLSGQPTLDDGKNVISGDQIIFFLDEDRSIVKSGRNRRVKTTIFPGDKNLGMGWK